MLSGKQHTKYDEKLLQDLRNGNHKAFTILYERYWSDVLDDAFKRLDDYDLSKDVVQEVFACLWAKAGTIEILNLPAWLTSVTKNQVFSILKKQQRLKPLSEIFLELEGHGDHSDAKLLRQELSDSYQALIKALPQQQRIIFNMRYAEDLSPNEIARLLNLSPKTVRNHLGRALLKIKTAITLLQIALVITEI
ncbi:RNA polymerase sigma factor [Desertivirga xinjiangensis]|uniref:RNA polymerase sigma factor n=1 Tax=Desertivirga xinjiangensis TaxID=539206 RepID=UPI00210936AC|nr:sigma-70 family RNA polymerase sigma factor [Pedobacter xinjiangensis]